VTQGPTVVDASAVVEYLVSMEFPRQAARLFGGLADLEPSIELWAPDLVYAETVSALRKLVQRRAIRPGEGAQAVEWLLRLPLVATGTADLARELWELRTWLTPYDACYAALAKRLGGALVTADGRLARTLTRRGYRAVFLGDL
jgi:predicted nucleic acid-binding protein